MRIDPLVMDEMFRLVVEARTEVMLVVEAYGIESAEEAGALKEMVGEEPMTKPLPDTEIPVPLVMVEVATD